MEIFRSNFNAGRRLISPGVGNDPFKKIPRYAKKERPIHSPKQRVNGSRKNRTTRMVVAVGLFSIDQAGKDWSYAGMPPKWLLLGAGLTGTSNDPSQTGDPYVPESPEAMARCSFIGFPAPSRQWCTTVSLSLYFEYRYFRRSTFDDFVHRRRSVPWMLSRAETYGRIFFISFDNDAMLNVARKLRLIARKYT